MDHKVSATVKHRQQYYQKESEANVINVVEASGAAALLRHHGRPAHDNQRVCSYPLLQGGGLFTAMQASKRVQGGALTS